MNNNVTGGKTMNGKSVYMVLLIMMCSFGTVYADDLRELKVEDAIITAQKRNNKLRMQGTNIEFADVNKDAAREHYYNSWDIGFEQASANYSKATANAEYERKNETRIQEQVAFDIETRFDEILELEEKYELALKGLSLQQEKVNHAMKKQQLGLGSEVTVKTEKMKMEAQNKEIDSIIQAIDAGYRKLNDAIGGKEERYRLIKENDYEPLDMKRSLQGQISYSIDKDIGIWLQEKIADADKVEFIAPGPDGGAPTYSLYQQRKLSYAQAQNNITLSKEAKEEQIKQIYENIQALEIQHDKLVIDLEDIQRQKGVMQKRYDLGMVPYINLREIDLAIMQNKVQLNSIVRQHNQLKIIFNKSYLS